ncbi:MAG TPA: hypothetical protein VFQ60_02740 [Patescibacteria group bacterium]|nr:hypothetical protein [Patescibacteria group bacterium]
MRMDFASWQYLIFVIPAGLSMVLAFGAVFGLGHDHDVGHDIDHDMDHDHDAGHEHESGKTVLDMQPEMLRPRSIGSMVGVLMGIGRVPISILLMIWFLCFGLTGLIVNILLEPITSFFVIFSLLAAFFVTFFFSGKVARGVNRIVPGKETESQTKEDLVGCSGKLTVKTTTEYGIANIEDRLRGIQNVQCRLKDNLDVKELPSGTRVTVVEYDEPNNMFTVEPASAELEITK